MIKSYIPLPQPIVDTEQGTICRGKVYTYSGELKT